MVKWDAEDFNLDLFSLEMFENIVFVVAKYSNPFILDTSEECMDGFNTFSIYQVLPKLIELWGQNLQTEAAAKKLHPIERKWLPPPRFSS